MRFPLLYCELSSNPLPVNGKMPLMMEEEMEVDIDDLFGDGAGLAMPARPPSKELYQRIDELRASGCCQ